jgi:two-component system, NarL family, sensor histidine kinase UhpB
MRLQNAIQNSSDAIYTCDAKGFIKTYNKAAVNLWGREPEVDKELWCGSWRMLNSDGKQLTIDRHPMAVALKEGRLIHGEELIVQRPDGSSKRISPYSSPLVNENGQLTGVVSMLVEISEQKDRERLSEEKYKNLIEQAADGIFIFDLTGRFLSVNTSGCKMLGYCNNETLLKLNLKDILPPQFAHRMPVKVEKLQKGEPLLLQRMFKRKDGSTFYTEVRAQLMPDGNIQAIVRDISERKNAEEKILQTIERYDILAKATSDTIWDWDVVNNRMLYNNVITAMFGYAADATGISIAWWESKIHPEDLKRVTEAVQAVFKNKLENFQLEYRFRCSDESYKYVLDRSFTIFDKQGNAIRMIGSMQDISERKKAEEDFKAMKRELMNQKIQEQKKITRAILNAQENERRHMGEELHDNINQMLAGTKLYLSVAGNKKPELMEALQYPLELIDDTMNEIRLLTRRSTTPKQNINLKELVHCLIETLQKNTVIKIHFAYNVATDFTDDDLKLNIYRIIQEQTNNIMKHAEASQVNIAIETSSNVIEITVADDGRGFDVNKRRPGIGISNIINRAETFNGKVEIKSTPGKGTSLELKIPY